MSWQLYRWVWQLRSPLHVGHTPAGALNRTRLYIPARSMWAALTAEIARRQASNFPDYAGVGQTLQQRARFTYLYPAERVNGKWQAWLPRYVQEEGRFGLYWYREDRAVGPFSDRAFRRRLLYTQASTAIAAGTGAAEEGTLREVEYIVPHWKPEQEQAHNPPLPVAFVGYVFLGDLPQHLQSALEDIREVFIGGEQRYGFGHLALNVHSEEQPWESASNCFGYAVRLNKSVPWIESSHLLAHAPLSSLQACGAWEVLVCWDWQTVQTENQPFWQPGTRVEQPDSFVIEPDGLWETSDS